eukprot:gene5221-5458_t
MTYGMIRSHDGGELVAMNTVDISDKKTSHNIVVGDLLNDYMLGFLDSPEQATDLLRHRFPSKVGGSPAWLDPVHLPTPEQLTCGTTGRLMRFLLQVYCPADSNPVEAFHRMIFMFVSPRLRRANQFYADTPAAAGQLVPQQLQMPHNVSCRLSGASSAGQRQLPVQILPISLTAILRRNYAACQVTIVEEEISGGGEDVQRLLSSYQSRIAAEGEYEEAELPGDLVDELEAAAGPAQAAFAAFQARCARAPEQVLRYCFQPGADALWPSLSHTPSPADIPPCPHCGTDRVFEFQVMPQLLSLMELDAADPHAPDWGTMAVYSCPRSCSAPPVEAASGHSTYVEEFVWVQTS